MGLLCLTLVYNSVLRVLPRLAIFSPRLIESWLLYLIVFLLSCGCYCSVSLPPGVMGWSVVCDCDISWSYSITFTFQFLEHQWLVYHG